MCAVHLLGEAIRLERPQWPEGIKGLGTSRVPKANVKALLKMIEKAVTDTRASHRGDASCRPTSAVACCTLFDRLLISEMRIRLRSRTYDEIRGGEELANDRFILCETLGEAVMMGKGAAEVAYAFFRRSLLVVLEKDVWGPVNGCFEKGGAEEAVISVVDVWRKAKLLFRWYGKLFYFLRTWVETSGLDARYDRMSGTSLTAEFLRLFYSAVYAKVRNKLWVAIAEVFIKDRERGVLRSVEEGVDEGKVRKSVRELIGMCSACESLHIDENPKDGFGVLENAVFSPFGRGRGDGKAFEWYEVGLVEGVLRQARDMYREYAAMWMRECGVMGGYVDKVDVALLEEKKRGVEMLGPRVEKRLGEVVGEVCVTEHVDDFLSSLSEALLDEKWEGVGVVMRVLYSLSSKEVVTMLGESLSEWVERSIHRAKDAAKSQRGAKGKMARERDRGFFATVEETAARCAWLVKNCCNDDAIILRLVHNAFSTNLSSPPPQLPPFHTLLASAIDTYIKTSRLPTPPTTPFKSGSSGSSGGGEGGGGRAGGDGRRAGGVELVAQDVFSREERLEALAQMSIYVDEKDKLLEDLVHRMSDRILTPLGFRIDLEAERRVVASLKTCNLPSVSILERLWQETAAKNPMVDEFAANYSMLRSTPTHPRITFQSRVFCSGSWPQPSMDLTSVVLPKPMALAKQAFEEAYMKVHEGKRLRVLLHRGSVTVRLHLPSPTSAPSAATPRWVDLECMTLQGVALTCIGTSPVSVREVSERSGLGEAMVERLLHPLVFNKPTAVLQLIRGEGGGEGGGKGEVMKKRVLFPTDQVKIQQKYTAGGRRRVMVPSIPLKAKADRERSVDVSRQHVVEGAIVRILKARTTCTLPDLVAATIRECDRVFRPTVQFIKARLETLIEREYVERNSMDRDKFTYIP